MRRKRFARTGASIEKYKARLTSDGSRMQKGVHYDMTYSLVARWNSVRMLLTLKALDRWHKNQIKFVKALIAQAPITKTLYMNKISTGITFECNDNPRDEVLKQDTSQHLQKKTSG